MCGIAGFSLHPDSDLPRALIAQMLLSGIAERGADAAGFAFRAGSEPITVHKQPGGASLLFTQLRQVPCDTDTLLLHTRELTKGAAMIAANNHPVSHGHVVGVHNGHIFNDEELFDAYGLGRDDPDATVDTEIIMALADSLWLELPFHELRGALATAIIDGRRPAETLLARGATRPLWLAEGEDGIMFASTGTALSLISAVFDRPFKVEALAEGCAFTVRGGEIVERRTFEPNRNWQLPATYVAEVSPKEQDACFALLDLELDAHGLAA
jgi:glucosamine 6-phosphate synthetase-like amidotransferase/phosphosugar isomerase protein